MTLGDKDSYLFVIRKDKAGFFKLNLTRMETATYVKTLRASLVDDTSFSADKSYELYQKLFGPAAMISDAKNLIVVPDGALESLPLAVLITSKPFDAGGQKFRAALSHVGHSRHFRPIRRESAYPRISGGIADIPQP